MKFLLLSLAFALATPPRPNPNPNFRAIVKLEIHEHSNGTSPVIFGTADIAVDFTDGKVAESVQLEKYPQYDTYVLQRYDLGLMVSFVRVIFSFPFFSLSLALSRSILRYSCISLHQYIITGEGNCTQSPINPPMPNEWAWIASASYNGTKIFRHVTYDLWTYAQGGYNIELAVSQSNPNVPVLVNSYGPTQDVLEYFVSFTPGVPPAGRFNVPPQCGGTTSTTSSQGSGSGSAAPSSSASFE
jgi:hypothetical protein